MARVSVHAGVFFIIIFFISKKKALRPLFRGSLLIFDVAKKKNRLNDSLLELFSVGVIEEI